MDLAMKLVGIERDFAALQEQTTTIELKRKALAVQRQDIETELRRCVTENNQRRAFSDPKTGDVVTVVFDTEKRHGVCQVFLAPASAAPAPASPPAARK